MPVCHVAAKYTLSWDTVKGIEKRTLARWQQSRKQPDLRMVGIDEKYLGRRGTWPERYITIISNLETGEPVYTSPGRSEASVKAWLDTLTPEDKANIKLSATDMHAPFQAAVRADPALAHAAWVHDPFHVIKRANRAVDELRRATFFRASAQLRAIGRGKRWHVVGPAARACAEERRANVPMRELHDSLDAHWNAIVALGEHYPPTGRIEALNTNWEALVRRGRGYRDLDCMLLKLRFMIVNPIRDEDGTKRFLALGMTQTASEAA